ncbi:MAG: hypothetical protein OCD76_08025 [Reichenbachiella sp.]
MKPNIKEIKPGYGLGELKFGMNRDEALSILGAPDEKEVHSYTDDDDQTENWHYDELELSLGFDQEDDWRLVTISITSQDYEFNKIKIIGLTNEQFSSQEKSLKMNDLEHEDMSTKESPAHELISSESLGINFWLDEGLISEVQWGPLLIDDETIKWPE